MASSSSSSSGSAKKGASPPFPPSRCPKSRRSISPPQPLPDFSTILADPPLPSTAQSPSFKLPLRSCTGADAFLRHRRLPRLAESPSLLVGEEMGELISSRAQFFTDRNEQLKREGVPKASSRRKTITAECKVGLDPLRCARDTTDCLLASRRARSTRSAFFSSTQGLTPPVPVLRTLSFAQ